MKQRGKTAKRSGSSGQDKRDDQNAMPPSWLERVKDERAAPTADGDDGAFWSTPEESPEAPAAATEAESSPPVADAVPDEAPDDQLDLQHAEAGHDMDMRSNEPEFRRPRQAGEGVPTKPERAPEPGERAWNVNPTTNLGDLVRGIPEQSPGPTFESSVGLSVGGLRQAALEMARRDAEAGLPALDATGRSETEQELRDRAHSLFEDWSARERERLNNQVAVQEGRVTEALGDVSLHVDRFERVTSELFRLQRRLEMNRSKVEATIEERHGSPSQQAAAKAEAEAKEKEKEEKEKEKKAEHGVRAFKTHWYAAAISFLGIVEFLANAPVFGALLPRDPLTEQQIRFVAETSEGWLAGALRVASQFILRPDAALLAAGVVTFLCVLAHFFGHSLRSLLFQRSAERSGHTVGSRSPMEYIVPMVIAGIGLCLVLGVLFEARVTLGRVASDRFAQDSAKIEELRRNASWLRVDGNLVAANEATNRADDLEALAKEQREYAESMSGLSFPIFLLNTTLVLVAISAAYFHMRDPRRDRFNELPWERQRRELIAFGDSVQERVSGAMGRAVQSIGEYRGMLTERPLKEAPALAHQLEATVVAYRAENGRLRGLDTREIPAFSEPVKLELDVDASHTADMRVQDPGYYDSERKRLAERFEKVRARFTEEATSW
ncbi:MAG: hypothetical protein PVF05_13225 [Gemmatimonadales bacterium]